MVPGMGGASSHRVYKTGAVGIPILRPPRNDLDPYRVRDHDETTKALTMPSSIPPPRLRGHPPGAKPFAPSGPGPR
jgi:hypothetical protein